MEKIILLCTRPDILFAVNIAVRKSKKTQTWKIGKVSLRILNIFKNILLYVLHFSKNNIIKIYINTDYVGGKPTRNTTSRFLNKIDDSLISWYSKLQNCVSTSTAKHECYNFRECVKHTMWYENMLNKL